MYKLFIIEDDVTISSELKKHFLSWDFEVEVATDFKNIIPQVTQFEPHIILLDIMLPFFNGFHWCSQMRSFSSVPVLFLSSASDNLNMVMAMNMGADDFIAKPFDLNVLTAKVQALLRRTYAFGGATNTLEHNGLLLNLSDTTITYNQEKLELTKNEYKILQLLLENNGKVVSRSAIMEHLWESDSYIDDNTLTVNMTRLRKKLESLGLEEYIRTRKGLGYQVV